MAEISGASTFMQGDVTAAPQLSNPGGSELVRLQTADGKVRWTTLAAVLQSQGAMLRLGSWDAATNTPSLTDGGGGVQNGFYVVAVAGATPLDGISEWRISDWVLSTGTAWTRLQFGAPRVSAEEIGAINTTSAGTEVRMYSAADLKDIIDARVAFLMQSVDSELIDGEYPSLDGDDILVIGDEDYLSLD